MSRSRRSVLVLVLLTAFASSAHAMPGDYCQCGDVSDDRLLSELDTAALRAYLASPTGAPLTPTGFGKCNVAGGSGSACDILDVAVLRRDLESLDPGIADTCNAQVGTNGNLVRFAAFGAQGQGNAGQLEVAAELRETYLDRCCDFMQLLGNNIYPSGASSTSDPAWTERFEVPYAAVDLPFWAVLGNHDYGLNGAGTDFTRGPIQVDYSATVSTKFEMPALYWQPSVEHVDFLGLDSNKTMGAVPYELAYAALGFVFIEIDGNTLTADFYDSNGINGFSYTLTKP